MRNSLSQNLRVVRPPVEGTGLAHPKALHFSRELCRYAKGPILEGVATATGENGGKGGLPGGVVANARSRRKGEKTPNFFNCHRSQRVAYDTW